MPANENVNIKVTAETAAALQAWKDVANGPLALEKALKRISELESRTSKTSATNLAGMLGRWVGIGTAIAGAREQLDKYAATLRQVEESQARSTAEADTAVRGYFAAARIADPKQQAASLQRIGAAALNRSSTLPQAGKAAELLKKFKFSREEAEGGSLIELLTLQDSVVAGGGDADTMARRVLEIIQRSGAPQTRQSIRQVAASLGQYTGRIAGFDEGTLGRYARVAPLAQRAGIPLATGLGMFGLLEETLDPRFARSKFQSLFDDKRLPGEGQEISQLRARAQAILGKGGEQEYLMAAEIGTSGVASRMAESTAARQLGEVRTGAISRTEARERLVALLNMYGVPEASSLAREGQAGILSGFDSPTPFGLFGDWFSTTHRAQSAAAAINQQLPFAQPEERGRRYKMLTEQIMGKQPLTIRLKTPDGRDIPHEVDAVGIQER